MGEIMNRIASIIKRLVRLAVKIILVPIFICLTFVEWICIIAVGFLRVFFSLTGFSIILIGILSFCFELEPASEIRRMIIVGVVFYILPMAADCITAGIGSLNIKMQKWLITG